MGTRSGKEYRIIHPDSNKNALPKDIIKIPPLIHPDLIKSEPPKYLSRFADSENTTPTSSKSTE